MNPVLLISPFKSWGFNLFDLASVSWVQLMKVAPVTSKVKQDNTEQSKQAHTSLWMYRSSSPVAEVLCSFRRKLNKMHVKAASLKF